MKLESNKNERLADTNPIHVSKDLADGAHCSHIRVLFVCTRFTLPTYFNTAQRKWRNLCVIGFLKSSTLSILLLPFMTHTSLHRSPHPQSSLQYSLIAFISIYIITQMIHRCSIIYCGNLIKAYLMVI